LERAVKSVLNQTYRNVEVLVVDDNNPDTDARIETEEIMCRLKALDERVNYLQHPFNKNGAAARNTGIFNSHGKYVALLDDDDEFKPNKIAVQLERMEKLDESWAACITGFDKLSDGKLVGIGAETKEGNILLDALGRNYYACSGSNLFIRRSVLDEIHGFNESFKRNQDLELLVRILQKYKVARCDANCLIINAHKRTTDIQAITDTFLKSFTPVIEEQAEEDRKRIYFLINLQLVRYYIVRKKSCLKAISLMRENEISIIDLIKYFKHLYYRYKTKKICGYPLNKKFK
jgi:glycosyltransferase involved in cell wall biosynthesis